MDDNYYVNYRFNDFLPTIPRDKMFDYQSQYPEGQKKMILKINIRDE
jgi:hypothetical protein